MHSKKVIFLFVFLVPLTVYAGYQIGYSNARNVERHKGYDDNHMNEARDLIKMLVLIRHYKPEALSGIECEIRSELSGILHVMKADLGKRVHDGADREYAEESIEYVGEFISRYEREYPLEGPCTARGISMEHLSKITRLDPWTTPDEL